MNKAVSISKGIGILLMVIGHAGCPNYMRSFIYVFHMPLFFFLSGYCFKERYFSEPRTFLLKRIKGLYLPYIKYALLFLLLHNMFFYLNIYNGEYGFNGKASFIYTFKDFLVRGFNIITRMTDSEQLLGGFWFLKQLLLASIIGFFTIRLFNRKGVVVLIIITYILLWTNIYIPFWGINWLSFLSASFFVIGYNFSKVKKVSHPLLCMIFSLLQNQISHMLITIKTVF